MAKIGNGNCFVRFQRRVFKCKDVLLGSFGGSSSFGALLSFVLNVYSMCANKKCHSYNLVSALSLTFETFDTEGHGKGYLNLQGFHKDPMLNVQSSPCWRYGLCVSAFALWGMQETAVVMKPAAPGATVYFHKIL